MKRSRTKLLFLLLLIPLILSACTAGASPFNSWPGVTADQNNAYVAYGSYVYAIRLSDGSQVWRFPANAGKGFYTSPTLTSDGQLIVGGRDNILYSLNPQTGAQNWTFTQSKDAYLAGISSNGQAIFAPSTDTRLYGLDLKGAELWRFQAKYALWAAALAKDNRIYLPSMDHTLYAIDPGTGKKIWATDMGGAVLGTPAISTDGNTLYAGTLGNEMLAVDANTGRVLWRFPTNGAVWSGPALEGNNLYFGDTKGSFYILDVTTQKSLPPSQPDAAIVSTPLVLKDKVILATETGGVQAFDPNGKSLWTRQVTSGKLYTQPMLAGDRILVAVTQGDQLLLALDQSNGNQAWAFVPPK